MKTISITDLDFFREEPSTSETASRMSLLPVAGYISKMGALTNETALRGLLITKNPKICQGEPIIKGTRISVSFIVELHYGLGWDIQKISDEYPSLSKEQIIAALEYYENHQKEIDVYLQQEKEVDVSDTPS